MIIYGITEVYYIRTIVLGQLIALKSFENYSTVSYFVSYFENLIFQSDQLSKKITQLNISFKDQSITSVRIMYIKRNIV